jgi:hypothetical protein
MAHAFCVGHTLYVYTISGYAHPERLAGPIPASLDTALLLSSVVGVCGTEIHAGHLLLCVLTLAYVP